MTNTLQRAIAEAGRLPDDAQERIGRELLAYLERLHALREDIGQGIRSLDAGLGREIDIAAVIQRARKDRGG